MKAIIIGGGIGGLTTAIALQQRGWHYEVYEAAPEYKAVGAGILLGANAMKVYRQLGIADALISQSGHLEQLYIKDYKGKVLQQIDNNLLQQQYGSRSVPIHRATLQAALLGYLNTPVRTGKKCIAVDETQNGVIARFEDGSETKGDILIAADGIRSAVREQYIGSHGYRYSGQTCWRTTVTMNLPMAERTVTSEVWGGKGNGVRASFMHVGGDQVYFWFTRRLPEGTPLTNDEALALIQRELSGFSGHMKEVVAHIDPSKLIRSDLYDLAPTQNWHKGHVVLLGDAAHATTPNLGQGASQAIEDAYALAESLFLHYAPDTAFRHYVAKRMKRAHKIVRMSWQLALLTNWQGSIAAGLRNFLVRNMPASTTKRQLDFLYNIEL
ncbi:NAD(P)-binding protein [Chitinophaga varians]|uniref:NAD(P)-binding protein n=1 Tax=Chitinophaga varians TaxID=2202339 RepID=A0A847S3U4_9BACT|nr:FAD-dependent monooxygenase [Chitinophaga varians]NLR68125.1 NAD(P)-binding protein [Chitinophaga varians]